ESMCGDETELSIRQLARIESGESKPTFTKITFIATGLGMSLYELMPDYVDLPEDYLNLKYDILRTPTYGENKKIDWRDQILTEIYDNYYDELPEEEQLAVDTIQSFFDVHD
ncbi:helix-turn-helix domain-containing protein, partial [Streptococcus pyogenes]